VFEEMGGSVRFLIFKSTSRVNPHANRRSFAAQILGGHAHPI
jgi:hypothetical protein